MMTGTPSSTKKHKQGYYADPRSPIASTPLKRQRTSQSASNSASNKSPKVEIPLVVEEESKTTRKLDMNIGDDEGNEISNGTKEDVDLFSPVLKVEKHGKKVKRTSITDTPPRSEPDAEIQEETSSQNDDELIDVDFNPFFFMKMLPTYSEVVEFVRPVALPAKNSDTPKICLVLDLDETLVHCTIDDLPQADLKFPIEYDSHEYIVSVKQRPYMMEFLSQVSEWFEIVVFTASQRVYAEKLLNLLDPYNQFIQHRLYRENCLPIDGNYLKDLNVLGRDLSHVLLIDNSPHAFGYQVSNGIPIESWFHDENDTELLKLLPFLESLLNSNDVRPIITKQFQIQRLIDASMIE